MCLSNADVLLGQTKPLQHRSHRRNALWDEPACSFLSSSTSLTLISLSLIIAPSAWQRPYHKCGQVYSEPSLRNIKSPWQPFLISFASSACIIYWSQIWSPCYSPRLHFHNCVFTFCVWCIAHCSVHPLSQPVSVWKEEVPVTLDQFGASAISSETVLRIRKWGVVKAVVIRLKKKGDCCILSQSSHGRFIVTVFHLPLQFVLVQAFTLLLSGVCPSSYRWNVEPGP